MLLAINPDQKLLKGGGGNRVGAPSQPTMRKIVTFKSEKSDSAGQQSPIQNKR